MNKQHILDEIRRTAEANAGVPLGQARFLRETGIKHYDWYGKYWIRWGDALREAGFAPNKLQSAYTEDRLLESFISLIRELGRFPVYGDLRLRRRRDPAFPSHNTFRRFGSKSQLASRILEYCRTHGYDDIAPLCLSIHAPEKSDAREHTRDPEPIGAVYLLKSSRYYKIGKTNATSLMAPTLQLSSGGSLCNGCYSKRAGMTGVT